MKYNPRDENSIKAVMAKANVVINLIGTWLMSSFVGFHIGGRGSLFDNSNGIFPGREYGTRNYSLEEVNHHMAAQLAKVICASSFPHFYCDYFCLSSCFYLFCFDICLLISSPLD